MKTTTILSAGFLVLLLSGSSLAQTSFSISSRSSGDTLLYIDSSGKVGIDTTAPSAGLHLAHPDGAVFGGSLATGNIPASGPGLRLMWYPGKAAFRAGLVTSGQWDNIYTGIYSMAVGYNTRAGGNYSVALGNSTYAGGTGATALGSHTTASGLYSTALGYGTVASGFYATAIGQSIQAAGQNAMAIALSDQNGTVVNQDSTLAIMGGRVGIGTVAPATALEVADTIYASSGGYKFPDGSVQTTAADAAGTGNSLDEAYDEGGAGTGRAITADAGAFEVNGTDGVLFSGNLGSGSIPAEGNGVRMMWYPGKAAIRAGNFLAMDPVYWSDDSTGIASVAFGESNRATANYSFAAGLGTKAHGNASVAMGEWNYAGAHNSTALGYYCRTGGRYALAMGQASQANGQWSLATGISTIASGDNSVTFGREIEAAGQNTIAIALSDQNGLQVSQDSTMAIMGGRVGVGTVTPVSEFEVSHASVAATSGLTIRNRNNGSRWSFYMQDADGDLSVRYNGGFMGQFLISSGAYTTTSDRRFKKNIGPLQASLDNILKLEPKKYHFLDQDDSEASSISFIAQEVLPLFPDLVTYNTDDDRYSLNYDNFSVLAIAAIKKQQKLIEKLEERISQLELQLTRTAGEKISCRENKHDSKNTG